MLLGGIFVVGFCLEWGPWKHVQGTQQVINEWTDVGMILRMPRGEAWNTPELR